MGHRVARGPASTRRRAMRANALAQPGLLLNKCTHPLFLSLLLASWGPCGEPGAVSPPRSVQDCIQRYGFDLVRFAACIEGMYRAGTP